VYNGEIKWSVSFANLRFNLPEYHTGLNDACTVHSALDFHITVAIKMAFVKVHHLLFQRNAWS